MGVISDRKALIKTLIHEQIQEMKLQKLFMI